MPERSSAAPAFVPGPVLGIETSCDETAVGIVADGRVLAACFSTQIPLHQRFGGVVPEVASRNHLLSLLPTLEATLAQADLGLDDLAGVAVTHRPGLLGALLVGTQSAATLALRRNLPLVGVHHIEAHCWAAMLDADGASAFRRPTLPALALAVSGGHTSLYRMDGPGQMTLLGQTLDDAAGEALDKFGKHIGLPYPAGPVIDRLAGQGDPERYALPRGMRGRTDLAMSFSGLKTAGRMQADAILAEGGDAALDAARADLCASYQEAVVRQLVDTTLRALRQTGLREVILAGGVAANSRLRAELGRACAARGVGFWPVAPRLCTDNGAMVAGLGSSLLAAGVRHDPLQLDASPTARPEIALVRASAREGRA
ncbi:MAG: tRNA (adenosine(37)-N6)-threonylcarbamoyltransferase complex transferase subunit TsaD [Deltaproteobacteria bacterium]|nr:tRNA (adenosine(37)-N6)-threonylcarbamoyltransferase complex transferase subunit TsaD [Deltaproteobacteria bacterium]